MGERVSEIQLACRRERHERGTEGAGAWHLRAERPQRVPRRIEDEFPTARIGHEHASGAVEDDAVDLRECGVAVLPIAVRGNEATGRREYLDASVREIGDPDIAGLRVDEGDAQPTELAIAVSPASDRADVSAAFVEHLDVAPAGIGDVQLATLIECDTARIDELARTAALAADQLEELPVRIEDLDSLVAAVANGDSPIRSDGDARALVAERRFAEVEVAVRGALLSPQRGRARGVPDHDTVVDPVRRIDIALHVDGDICVLSG